jgi:hypothetical protein
LYHLAGVGIAGILSILWCKLLICIDNKYCNYNHHNLALMLL